MVLNHKKKAAKKIKKENSILRHIVKGACSVESFVDFNACDLVLLRRTVRIRSLNDFTTVFFSSTMAKNIERITTL